MTIDDERREIYFGSRAWEAERVNAVVLARMERLAEVRIAVGEIEAARYAAEEKTMTKTKKVVDG